MVCIISIDTTSCETLDQAIDRLKIAGGIVCSAHANMDVSDAIRQRSAFHTVRVVPCLPPLRQSRQQKQAAGRTRFMDQG